MKHNCHVGKVSQKIALASTVECQPSATDQLLKDTERFLTEVDQFIGTPVPTDFEGLRLWKSVRSVLETKLNGLKVRVAELRSSI